MLDLKKKKKDRKKKTRSRHHWGSAAIVRRVCVTGSALPPWLRCRGDEQAVRRDARGRRWRVAGGSGHVAAVPTMLLPSSKTPFLDKGKGRSRPPRGREQPEQRGAASREVPWRNGRARQGRGSVLRDRPLPRRCFAALPGTMLCCVPGRRVGSCLRAALLRLRGPGARAQAKTVALSPHRCCREGWSSAGGMAPAAATTASRMRLLADERCRTVSVPM